MQDVISHEMEPTSSSTSSENLENIQLHSKKPMNSSEKIYKRKRDHCYFCESDVLNFGRHILRSHPMEFEVSQISSMPPKSRQRRQMIDMLRRKGNYLSENSKPVRESYIPNQSVLPCDNCLGLFSAKLLYRHRNKCGKKLPGNAQTAAQSQMTSHVRVDRRLSSQVFPHMRADKTSLEVKKDPLICAYGARYLTTHREKHFINITSRKMRELGRLLLEIKKLQPTIRNMTQALDPQYFDLFVEATKIISKYNADTDRYESPTLAMNIVNSLKDCCDIALTFLMTKKNHNNGINSAEAEANFRGMLHLFKSNWRFEISSHAASNLNLNKWNKVTIVPLAKDLKLLKQYLKRVAEGAIRKLNKNKFDTSAYTELTETVYCRVILLNRKRPGELERMLVHTYISSENKPTYEEFGQTITPTERILLKKLKRIVIRGKRGRGVPVLFSQDVQDHLNILLESRSNFVPKENNYLFGRVNLLTPISGYKVLSKYAKACGAKNPSAITSTRLRKHLATLTQLFNMNDQDIEQLATFMGHTPGVHRNSYRLPDDIYQTAKISKILLLMEEGGAGQFKGKSIDEINIEMDTNLLENNNSDSDSEDFPEYISNNQNEELNGEAMEKTPNVTKRGKKRELIPWTAEQKNIVKKFFKLHIKNKKPPKRSECEDLIQSYPDPLKNKNWLKIKVFVQNEYTKKNKPKRYIESDSE